MLKLWQMSGAAAVLGVFLSACSTPPVSQTEMGPPPPSVFITVFTNQPPKPIAAASTEAPPIPIPAPVYPVVETNAPVLAMPESVTNSLVRTTPGPPATARPLPARASSAVGKGSPSLPTEPLAAPLLPTPAPVSKPLVKPPESKPTRSATWRRWDEWAQAAGWGQPERVRNVANLTFQAKGSHGQLEITIGKQTALWNGLNLELGFAPRMIGNEPFVHTLDLDKTFEPLTRPPGFLQRPNRLVVIDPGHGGFNYGAKSALGERFEKELALDWAFRIERLLSERGWTVRLTRTNDIDIPLAERVAFADRAGADLFVSLHFNSTEENQGKADQGGVETYCLTPVGMPSTLTRDYDDEFRTSFPNNVFDSDNYYVATRVHSALVRATQRKDRGVRRARFMGVLRTQNRPAILVEGGYLTNPAEARLISTPHYRQKLAEAVAQALTP